MMDLTHKKRKAHVKNRKEKNLELELHSTDTMSKVTQNTLLCTSFRTLLSNSMRTASDCRFTSAS